MEKLDFAQFCNFKKHEGNVESYYCLLYCYNCNLSMCSECVLAHNSNPNNVTHKTLEINKEIQDIKKKIHEIKRDKTLFGVSKEERMRIGNTQIREFTEKLSNLNIVFKDMVTAYKKGYDEIQNKKNDLEKRMKNKEKNLEEEIQMINNNYDELIKKQQSIEELYNSVENMLNNKQIQQKGNNIKQLIVCSNINNFNILNNANLIDNKNNIIESKEQKINQKDDFKPLDKEKKIISFSLQKNEQNKNNINFQSILPKNQIHPNNDSMNLLNINSQKYPSHDSIYTNKKIQRERTKNYEKNGSESSDYSFDNKEYKKRKLDDINFSQNKDNNSEITSNKNKIISQQINNYKVNVNNYYINNISNVSDIKEKESQIDTSFNFYNLRLNKEGEVSISLKSIIDNMSTIKSYGPKEIKHNIPFLHSEKFPFICSRLVNIDNKAFIIGGKSYFDNNNQGNCLVFRINFVNNINNNGYKEVFSSPLKSTNFPHQSHHLIYSKLYNTIFVISGKNQKACEYGILDKSKDLIQEWKEMDSVRYPRENALCFLFNEKYIYLFNDKIELNSNESEYDVFDISNLDGKWKNFSVKTNNDNRAIFGTKIAGIIESGKNIYVLGGSVYGLGNNLNWKITFTEDEKDQTDNEYKRIDSIFNLPINKINKSKGILSFYGQQRFVKYHDYFMNINIQGKDIQFQQNHFDENI